MNGRVWMNDPDVFFLRKDNLTFTDEQKYLLGKINNLCGNVLFVSDNAGDYDDVASNLVKKFFHKTDEKIITAEYLNKSDIRLVTEKNGKREIFIFNLDKGEILSDKSCKKYFV